jgi:hypothetical protein
MPITLFGLNDRPHEVGVSKTCDAPGECAFLLDFSRPLEKIRWLGIRNRAVGPTVALLVPVVHAGEKAGSFVFGVSRGELYFEDIPNLWRKHQTFPRVLNGEELDGLQIAADFGRHFPEDCA